MKKILTIAAALTFGASAFADDFSLYCDTQAEAGQKVESVANLQKIIFKDGEMVVVKTDGTSFSASLKGVTRLFFSTEEAMNIDATETAEAKERMTYDLTGRRLGTIATDNLPKGLYIIDGKKVFISR